MSEPSECNSSEGKIVGILDGINTLVRILNENFRTEEYYEAWKGDAVKQALLDLAAVTQVSFGDREIRVVFANVMGWNPDKLNDWYNLHELEQAMRPATQSKTFNPGKSR